MNTICNIYKTGFGPSSSHSMGPRKAAELFLAKIGQKPSFIRVELFGSLAATGKGHLTDKAIIEALSPIITEINWQPDTILPEHPNAMTFLAFDSNNNELANWQVYSVGGGDLEDENGFVGQKLDVTYPSDLMGEILTYCKEKNLNYWQLVKQFEGPEIWDFLRNVWHTMAKSVENGCNTKEKHLPGNIKLQRRAGVMLSKANNSVGISRDLNLLSAFALAVSEENAAGGQIVTAPTCGSCGILPSVLWYYYKYKNVREKDILRALATAGLFGASVAKRASISGAEVGCQGEVGTACAMAAAAAAQLMKGTLTQIEYAAEMAMEHSLGLTCDPVLGMVQIPCIERNAFGATRAYESATYALATDGDHVVSFDDVIDVMKDTGHDLQSKYRETAHGGLAQIARLRYFGNK
ncbi:MAG: L-serine ammonia-lyase [Phycisphaerae bacterium]|nr:L-serine ammonia-lyase [Phycisphaerae bacterium]